MMEIVSRLAIEPPFRILARALLKHMPVSVKTRALWELSARPAYLLGVVTAAEQARRQNISEISVLEFGVAGGEGLLALEHEAEAVEKETGIKVKAYGFDMGCRGLPSFIGDHRDHPDAWCPRDYPMDEEALRARLTGRTTLIIGNVAETIGSFFKNLEPPPIGFVSFDLDLFLRRVTHYGYLCFKIRRCSGMSLYILMTSTFSLITASQGNISDRPFQSAK